MGAPSDAKAAGTYPERPVTIVVPYPPAGGTDVGTRIITPKLADLWSKPVIVENRGGAAGSIGADYVARARPDGYTLLMGTIGSQTIDPFVYRNLAYNLGALVPIAVVAFLPLVLVVPSASRVRSVGDLVNLARRGSPVSFSSSGIGGAPHIAAELMQQQTGAVMTHVPYKGGGPAAIDLMAGVVDFSVLTVVEVAGHVAAGRLRAIAVTGDKRVKNLPHVPTFAEHGFAGVDLVAWIGLFAPLGTPRETLDQIDQGVMTVLRMPDVQSRYEELGGYAGGLDRPAFQSMIARDRARFSRLVADRGIYVD